MGPAAGAVAHHAVRQLGEGEEEPPAAQRLIERGEVGEDGIKEKGPPLAGRVGVGVVDQAGQAPAGLGGAQEAGQAGGVALEREGVGGRQPQPQDEEPGGEALEEERAPRRRRRQRDQRQHGGERRQPLRDEVAHEALRQEQVEGKEAAGEPGEASLEDPVPSSPYLLFLPPPCRENPESEGQRRERELFHPRIGAEDEPRQDQELERQRVPARADSFHAQLVGAEGPLGREEVRQEDDRDDQQHSGEERRERPERPAPSRPPHEDQPGHRGGEEQEELEVDEVETERQRREQEPRAGAEAPLSTQSLQQPVGHGQAGEEQRVGEKGPHEPPRVGVVVRRRERQKGVPVRPAQAAGEGERRRPHRRDRQGHGELPRHLDRQQPGEPGRQPLEERLRRRPGDAVGRGEAPRRVPPEAERGRHRQVLRVVDHRREGGEPDGKGPERRGGGDEEGAAPRSRRRRRGRHETRF